MSSKGKVGVQSSDRIRGSSRKGSGPQAQNPAGERREGGCECGCKGEKPAEAPANLFISSNAVFLAVWFSYVLTGFTTALIAQIAAFLYLLFVDYRMQQSRLLSRRYFRIRAIATAAAVVSLALIAVTR